MMWIVGIIVIVICVWLKRKFDPNDDAFRTVERPGWSFKKAGVIRFTKPTPVEDTEPEFHDWKAPVIQLKKKR